MERCEESSKRGWRRTTLGTERPLLNGFIRHQHNPDRSPKVTCISCVATNNCSVGEPGDERVRPGGPSLPGTNEKRVDTISCPPHVVASSILAFRRYLQQEGPQVPHELHDGQPQSAGLPLQAHAQAAFVVQQSLAAVPVAPAEVMPMAKRAAAKPSPIILIALRMIVS